MRGQAASESQLKELDFNYTAYKQSLARIKDALSDHTKGDIPDSLLQLEGYGLISHDAALRLKLEVAQLRNESPEKIKKLEQELMNTRKEIEEFLAKTHKDGTR